MSEKPMSLMQRLKEIAQPNSGPDDKVKIVYLKEVLELLDEAAASWPKYCAFYLEEGTGAKDEDKSCEKCIYHPDNIHEINDGLTKDEWHSAPCEFPDTKKKVFGGGGGVAE